jgi:hypothetical protein
VPADFSSIGDVFVKDLSTGAIVRVSEKVGGEGGIRSSEQPRISADGALVAFGSPADNLVPNDTNGWSDIFVGANALALIGAGQ